MERTLEQRVDELEKQVAELREAAQPKEVDVKLICNTITNTMARLFHH